MPVRAALLVAALAAPLASAQTTFTVTTTANSGAGSLRQAITDANAAPGADVIAFAIPGAGPHTLTLTSALPIVTDAVTIDGLTQPGASCDAWPATLQIEIEGSNAGAGNGIELTNGSTGSTVRGLVINRFRSVGGFSGHGILIRNSSDHVVECMVIGTDVAGTRALPNEGNGILLSNGSDTRIGGPSLSQRVLVAGNRFIGIEIEGYPTSTGNIIQGSYIGTNAAGTAALPNDNDGILIDNASRTLIGGDTPAHGNLISGNGDDGIDVYGTDTFFTIIQNNRIGTDVTGRAALGNLDDGIDLNGGTSNSNVYDNVIVANAENGVQITGTETQNNVLARNFIGTTPEGDVFGNGENGIEAVNSGPQVIGGTYRPDGQCCEGNTIAFNTENGVTLAAPVSVSFDKGILSNRIYQNGGLGIDLEDDGPTPNDPGDADGNSSANRLQNFPDLRSVGPIAGAGTVKVAYAVDSTPGLPNVGGSTYPLRIEFFLADVDGEEGRLLIGRDTYTESDHGACVASGGVAPCPKTVTFTPEAAVAAGDRIVATATDALANTSEFSGSAVAVRGESGPETAPLALAVSPNPASGGATLRLTLDAPQRLAVVVLDAQGREVARLHDGPLAAGAHALVLDTAALPAGVYVVRADGRAGVVTQRLTVVR